MCHHFPLLTVKQLSTFLNDNQLNVYSEIYVWRAVITWINFDVNARLEHFWQLFPFVRFNLIPRQLINQEVVPQFCLLDVTHERKLSLMMAHQSKINGFSLFCVNFENMSRGMYTKQTNYNMFSRGVIQSIEVNHMGNEIKEFRGYKRVRAMFAK